MTLTAFQSATTLLRRIRAGELGCLELLEYFLKRVAAHNPAVNAVVVQDLATARKRAIDADRTLARGGQIGPLHGLPMTIKESFQLKDTPTTFGFPEFKGNIAATHAVAVERLLHAGANIFGKTNVPPGLMDGQSNNPIYGRTNNPWDLGRTPGGSSGGSAAALAAGLTGLELGSDIASSIRNPAHYCGVFGHKPTYGICPQRGHALSDTVQAIDIGVVGPLARSAADLELALAILAKPDEVESRAYSITLASAWQKDFRDFRVAIVSDDEFAEVDHEVRLQLDTLASFLSARGAKVLTEERPRFDSRELYALYMVLLRAAGSASLSDESFAQESEQARGTSRATRDMAKLNAYGATLSHRDWLRLDEERHRYRVKWLEFFSGVDLLLCPPLSSAAFPHSDMPPQQRSLVVNNHEVPFENQLFWAGYAGVVHLPATVAPIGRTATGLPVGVQIIGPQYADLTCLRFARLLEEHYRAFVPPEGFAD